MMGGGKLPRTSSSRSTHGRARRRHRQWHAPCWFSVLAVFPSYVGRPELPGIIVGLDQKDFLHRARRRLRQWHVLSWVLLVAFRAVRKSSCRFCHGAEAASWQVRTKRTVMRSSVPAVACARLVLRVTSRCVPPVCRPRCLVGRPATRSASWPEWTRGTFFWREGRRHHPCRCAEAHPHGFSDHGDSTVAVLGPGDRCPLRSARVHSVPASPWSKASIWSAAHCITLLACGQSALMNSINLCANMRNCSSSPLYGAGLPMPLMSYDVAGCVFVFTLVGDDRAQHCHVPVLLLLWSFLRLVVDQRCNQLLHPCFKHCYL